MADYIVLEGSSKWAKVFEDNRDMTNWDGTPSDCGGKYTIDIGLSKDSEASLLSYGSKVTQKKDASGDLVFDDNDMPVYKFNRKHEGPFDAAGGAPKVYHANGNQWDFATDGSIGNGSSVKVKVCLYPSKYGKFARLESVVVTKLVEFDDGPKNWDEEMFDTDVAADTGDDVPF